MQYAIDTWNWTTSWFWTTTTLPVDEKKNETPSSTTPSTQTIVTLETSEAEAIRKKAAEKLRKQAAEKLRKQKNDINIKDVQTEEHKSFVRQFFAELGRIALMRRAKLDKWEAEHLPEQQKKHEARLAEHKQLLAAIEAREAQGLGNKRKSSAAIATPASAIVSKSTPPVPVPELSALLQQIRDRVKLE